MRYQRIIEQVFTRPWLITPQAHAAIRQLLMSKIRGDDLADIFGEEIPGPVIREGVAEIPIKGVILKGATKLEKSCGAVGTEDVEDWTALAVNNPEVEAILYDIDSPGGTVGGVAELAEIMQEASAVVPTTAYTDGIMASAAYWLGTSAEQVYASKGAEVGSIGVYMPWIDESEAFAAEGITVEIIRNEGADLKGAGYPGTSLTEAQRADLQKQVNQIAADFHEHVLASRPSKFRGQAQDSFRGQTFLAAEAVERGVIDGVLSRRALMQAIRGDKKRKS